MHKQVCICIHLSLSLYARVCVCVCARERDALHIFYSQIVEESPFVSHGTTGGFRLTNEFLCVLINQASHTHTHTHERAMHAHTLFFFYNIG